MKLPAMMRAPAMHTCAPKSVYPASAEVAFHYGNFLLREQQYPEAYAEFQRAVRTDPTLLPLAISRTWRSSEDVNQLLNHVLPANADAYLQALDFFASIHQGAARSGGLAAFAGSREVRSASARISVFRGTHPRGPRGRCAQCMARGAGRCGPASRPARQSKPDLERKFRAGFCEWRSGLALDSADGRRNWIDSEPAPNGSRAVRVDFNGGSNLCAGLSPRSTSRSNPGRSYRFHAFMRTEGITTESGLRFQITDPNHNGALNVATENFTGSHPWTSVDADLTTGPATHFLAGATVSRAEQALREQA